MLHVQQHGAITNIKKISIRMLALACKPGNSCFDIKTSISSVPLEQYSSSSYTIPHKRVEGQSTRVRSACAPGAILQLCRMCPTLDNMSILKYFEVLPSKPGPSKNYTSERLSPTFTTQDLGGGKLGNFVTLNLNINGYDRSGKLC